MNKLIARGVLSLLFVSLYYSAPANAAAESSELSLLVGLALETHPLIQSKRSESIAAEANLEGAEWGRYPVPTLESGYDEKTSELESVLRVDQPLWTGGRITSLISAAEARKEAADAAIDEAGLDIVLRTVSAYSEALNQKRKLNHAQAGLASHDRLLAMIKRRVKQEISSVADLRLAESRYFSAQTDVAVIQQAYDDALMRLSQLAGVDVVGVNDVPGLVSLELGSKSQLVEEAQAYSPLLNRLGLEIAASSADVDTARSAYMPQISARFEHSNSASSVDNRFLIVFQAQPGSGLAALSGVKSAEAIKRSLEDARDAARREVEETVQSDYNEWRATSARLDSTRQASEISNQVFESYTRQYVIGKKTWIDVLNATRELTQSRFALEDAIAQSIASKLRVLVYTGRLASFLSKR